MIWCARKMAVRLFEWCNKIVGWPTLWYLTSYYYPQNESLANRIKIMYLGRACDPRAGSTWSACPQVWSNSAHKPWALIHTPLRLAKKNPTDHQGWYTIYSSGPQFCNWNTCNFFSAEVKYLESEIWKGLDRNKWNLLESKSNSMHELEVESCLTGTWYTCLEGIFTFTCHLWKNM